MFMSGKLLAVPAEKSTKIQAADSASIEAGIVIDVLGVTLAAMLERSESDTGEKDSDGKPVMEPGTRVLVCPATDNSGNNVSLSTILVKAGLENKKKDVASVLKYLGLPEDTDKVFIDVNQAFYYFSNHKADVDGNKNQEYALSLGISQNAGDTDLPFEVKSVYFSVWNTTRQSIINSMNMITADKMLEKLK